MEELLNQLLTRDNIAELCRVCETMIENRRINTYDIDGQEREDIPKTVREYNKELKKAKYDVYGIKGEVY